MLPLSTMSPKITLRKKSRIAEAGHFTGRTLFLTSNHEFHNIRYTQSWHIILWWIVNKATGHKAKAKVMSRDLKVKDFQHSPRPGQGQPGMIKARPRPRPDTSKARPRPRPGMIKARPRPRRDTSKARPRPGMIKARPRPRPDTSKARNDQGQTRPRPGQGQGHTVTVPDQIKGSDTTSTYCRASRLI